MPDLLFSLIFQLSQLLLLLTAVTIGVRLLWLASRTRQLPELLIGFNFLVGYGCGVVLASLALAAMQGADRPDESLLGGLASIAPALIGIGHLLIDSGIGSGVLFTYVVFRRGEGWARAIVALCFLGLLSGLVGFGLTNGFTELAGFWYWFRYSWAAVGALWGAAEAFRYYALMRRRMLWGLADPLVTNRFLLWAAGSSCSCVLIALGSVPALTQSLDPHLRSLIGVGTSIVATAIGCSAALLYALTFLPTRGYRRAVKRWAERLIAAETAAVTEEGLSL